jgi:protein TonB
MPSRLILALTLSLALHGGLLLPDAYQRLGAASPPPALRASLRLPPAPELAPPEPLLKNTLDVEKPTPAAKRTLPARPSSNLRPANAKRAVTAAQKKLSQHLYYPPEALKRGIEGEVRLLITLTAEGHIADVNVAASSGHPILDNAAIRAVYAMGALSQSETRELILPVIFRLQ